MATAGKDVERGMATGGKEVREEWQQGEEVRRGMATGGKEVRRGMASGYLGPFYRRYNLALWINSVLQSSCMNINCSSLPQLKALGGQPLHTIDHWQVLSIGWEECQCGRILILFELYCHMGSHTSSSEDLPPFLEEGCCSARSLWWLKIVPSNVCRSKIVPPNVCSSKIVPRNVCSSKIVPRHVCSSKIVPRHVCSSKIVPRHVCSSKIVPRNVCSSKIVPRNVCSA